jgi:hypothetical protein
MNLRIVALIQKKYLHNIQVKNKFVRNLEIVYLCEKFALCI